MDPALLLAIPAVKKIIDLYRFLFDGTVQVRAAVITVGSWVLGTGVVALVGASSFGADLGLSGLNLVDLIFVGIGLGSTAGVIHDYIPPGNNLIS
jgi:hypothetical protein